MKKYTLMHKNIAVANLVFDKVIGAISCIEEVFSEQHVPVGITVKNGVIDRSELNQWWTGRGIPASRAGIEQALIELQISSTDFLLVKCLRLSLSD